MRRIVLVFVLLMLAVAAPASAQSPLDQAKALTNEASVQYKLGRFSAALDGYTHAYESYPTAGLLFNIAQCHRMLKNYEQAIYFYKGYLRDKPDATNRADVETLITETERDLQAQRAAAEGEAQARARAAQDEAERAAAEARARAAEEEARAAEERARVQAATPTPTAPMASAPSTSRGSPAQRIAGVAVGAAGVVVLGTAVYFGVHASSDSSTIAQLSSQRATWSTHDASVYSDGTRSANVANVLYVVGAATLATGGVLAFLGWRKTAAPPPVSATIAPVGSLGGRPQTPGSPRSLDSAPAGASLLVAGSF
jgi:tetratricopeptide (TPR) repeat protein